MESTNFEYEVYEDIPIKDEPVTDTPEISTNNWQAQAEQPTAEESHIKCGEIFIEPGQTYILICSLCTKQFNDLESFGVHVNSSHLYELDAECKPLEHLDFDQIATTCNEKSLQQDAMELPESMVQPELHSIPKDAIEHNSNLRAEICEDSWRQPHITSLGNQAAVLTNSIKSELECTADEDVWAVENEECTISSKLFSHLEKDSMAEGLAKSNVRSKVSDSKCMDSILQNKPDEISVESQSGIGLTTNSDTKISDSVSEDRQNIDGESDGVSKTKTFSCSLCGKEYKHKQSYSKHLRKQHGIFSEFMKEKMQKDAEKAAQNSANEDTSKPVEPPPQKILFCSFCNHSYTQKYRLLTHVKLAHGAEAVVNMFPEKTRCRYCGDNFKDKQGLIAHIESSHPGDRKYPCPDCEKCFKNRNARTVHMNVHRGARDFNCSHCPKTFKHRANLAVHLRLHMQIKNHGCRFCEKRFVTSSERKAHERYHTGEKSQKCDVCGKGFRTLFHLNEHSIRHGSERNFKCDVCEKAFFTARTLKDHKLGHSSERPFCCNTCGLTFSRQKTLKMHEKLHLDVKKYVCSTCGKAFAQYIGLYKHKKTHNEIN